MDKKQFAVLICAIIFSAIVLSLGIALQNGLYSCEKFVWEGSDLVWFRLNRFTGSMTLFDWNKTTKRFDRVFLSREKIALKIKEIDEKLARLKRGEPVESKGYDLWLSNDKNWLRKNEQDKLEKEKKELILLK